MTAYYNEHDRHAAAWLRELIKEGHIAPGDVDERDIQEVKPDDIRHYTQVHFFAGIGGWSLALRLAGWPDDRRVWTGSCPCQPFSDAGQGKGVEDERHLWPVFAELIRACEPPVTLGEQVASKAGREWLAGVFADLERMGHQRAGADLCAAGVGSPHIRQRLFWMAHTASTRRSRGIPGNERRPQPQIQSGGQGDRREWVEQPFGRGDAGGVAHAGSTRANALSKEVQPRNYPLGEPSRNGWMGYAGREGLEGHAGHGDDGDEPGRQHADQARPVATAGRVDWNASRWHLCSDGKHRRVPLERELFPLAHGFSHKLGGVRAILEGMGFSPKEVRRRLRKPRSLLALAGKYRTGGLKGAGNAICPELAATFIEEVMACIAEMEVA